MPTFMAPRLKMITYCRRVHPVLLGEHCQLHQFAWRELLSRRLVSKIQFSHGALSTRLSGFAEWQGPDQCCWAGLPKRCNRQQHNVIGDHDGNDPRPAYLVKAVAGRRAVDQIVAKSDTAMLPRVALEYGHTRCAWFISSSAVC